MRELPIAVEATPETIAKMLLERGIPRAEFDHIEYNLGRGAAIVACLTGKWRTHDHVPGEACQCS